MMTYYTGLGMFIAAALIASPIMAYVISYAASEAYHASKLRYQIRFMHQMARHPKPATEEKP